MCGVIQQVEGTFTCIGRSTGGAPGTRAPPLGKNVKWVELPSGCVVPGSWSGPLALKAKLICGGLLGSAFSECGSLGGDTMPGQGLLQVPLCRRIPQLL